MLQISLEQILEVASEYTSTSDLVRAIDLIVGNCMQYNDPKSYLYSLAGTLKRAFTSLYTKACNVQLTALANQKPDVKMCDAASSGGALKESVQNKRKRENTEDSAERNSESKPMTKAARVSGQSKSTGALQTASLDIGAGGNAAEDIRRFMGQPPGKILATLRRLINAIEDAKLPSGVPCHTLFRSNPRHPDYFIPGLPPPIGLDELTARCNAGQVYSKEALQDEVRRIVADARKFNETGSQIVSNTFM